ncbi:site-specific integrase [Sedimenticola hydrogenitrophicus]|uniref:site-specific integrase n=1 Tax=Sedimenticola hydrogenitrophicus TaxID=2967975 RepID=UPI0023B16F89|nr:site-specific integrase [Sedimenticola hydrogenitrophicus]
MASFTKLKSGKWRAQVRKDGVYTSKTFSTKTAAKTWAQRIEVAIETGDYQTEQVQLPTLGKLLDRYETEFTARKKSNKAERSRLRTLHADELAKQPLERITAPDIAALRDRLAKTRSSGTVRLMIALISHVYTVARKEWALPVANPVMDIRKPPPGRARDRRLSRDETAQLFRLGRRHRNPELLIIIRLAIETGMRQGELLGLTWEDVDLAARIIHLKDTKNGSDRGVPLSRRALRILRRLDPGENAGKLFTYTGDGLRASWKKLLKKGNIEGLRFHDLRHEACSQLFEKGLDSMEVAAITGHKTLQMLKRYTHLHAGKLADKLG